ncbi:MAG: GAF domain-containing protein [Candidatus Schekmanbacteria bacterium]|nr:GAF domain-containing protein [Candidatus Schekmanbacteria bacterium]
MGASGIDPATNSGQLGLGTGVAPSETAMDALLDDFLGSVLDHLRGPLASAYRIERAFVDAIEVSRRTAGVGSCWIVALPADGTVGSSVRNWVVRTDQRLIAVAHPRVLNAATLNRRLFDLLIAPVEPILLEFSLRNAFASIDQRADLREKARQVLVAEYERSQLMEISNTLSSEHDLEKLLTMILERSRFITGADAGTIYIVEERHVESGAGVPQPATGRGRSPAAPELDPGEPAMEKVLRFKYLQNFSIQVDSNEFTIPINEKSVAGYVALRGVPLNIADCYNMPDDVPYSFNTNIDKELGYKTRSMLTVPMINKQDTVIGVIQLINRKRDLNCKLLSSNDFATQVVPFAKHDIEMVTSLASQAGISLENAILYLDIQRLFDGFVQASVLAIESRDPTTSGHSHRVANLSLELMENVGRCDVGPYHDVSFTRQDFKVMRYASLLHDFGKVGVREQVLVKAKKLYPVEKERLVNRIRFARRGLEAEFLRRRADALERFGPEGAAESVHALEKHLHQESERLDQFLGLILDANEPTVLEQDVAERLHELRMVLVEDFDEMRRPLLSEPELVALAIPKGSLTPKERLEIESHVTHTYRFLRKIPWSPDLRQVPSIARGHHEKLDGSGYPHGLKSEQIAVPTRIMTICDIFDALTASDRPYKRAVPWEFALDILAREAKIGQIDTELLRIFIDSRTYEIVMRPGAELTPPLEP